ncbi:hypothetical protein M8J77_005355 [Diaphorina citri]|nr:hypothetical protein M8J77_005355 [Diaphorina citri]
MEQVRQPVIRVDKNQGSNSDNTGSVPEAAREPLQGQKFKLGRWSRGSLIRAASSFDVECTSFPLITEVKKRCISIYTAELLAIVQCMEKITQLPSPSPQYLIVSDSKSSLCAIKNVKSNNNPLVNRIYQLWLQLNSVEVILRFLWCPSHCGITGNEVVDRAAQSENYNSDLNVITPDDMSPFIKKMCLSSWQNEWNNVNPNNKLKSVKPEIGRWDSSNRPNRYQEVVLTRLRIGHTRLTHSFLFTKSPPPICDCGEPLTVKHVILSCPIHEPLRHTYDTTPSLGNSTASVDAVMDLLNRLELFHRI